MTGSLQSEVLQSPDSDNENQISLPEDFTLKRYLLQDAFLSCKMMNRLAKKNEQPQAPITIQVQV